MQVVPEWMSGEALETLNKGYLQTGETPRDMFHRLSNAAARYLNRPDLEAEFFEVFWNGWLGPASPVAANFGTSRALPISCYSVHVSDSISSIYSHLKEAAALSKNGGGVGIYLGDVRPAGSPFASTGKSTGVAPVSRLFDQTAAYVSQGGVRRGSFAAYLPIDHPDVPELLRAKDHSKGDPRTFIDSNLGLTVTDEWLESMIAGDGEKQELFGEVLRTRLISGSPYLIFIDNVNRQNPPCYTERGLKVSTSNLCFTGETLVAVADGRNVVPISELVGTSFPVYSARPRRKSNGEPMEQWVPEIKNAVAFCTGEREVIEVELEDGSTFRCTPDHLLAMKNTEWVEAQHSVGKIIEPFTSRTNSYGHKEICCDAGVRKQGRMIWEFFNGGVPEGSHVDHIVSGGGDHLENLQLLTREDHFEKTSKERMGDNNPIHKIDKDFHSAYTSASTTGKKNPKFCGLDNFELIELGKEIYAELGYFDRAAYLSLREKGYNVPLTFSNYRFGGSFETFKSFVIGEAEYNGKWDVELKRPVNRRKEMFEE